MPRSSANWMMWLVESHPHVRMSSFFPPRANFAKIVFFKTQGHFPSCFIFFSSCSLQEIRQLRPMETQSIELVGCPGPRGPLPPVTLAKRQKKSLERSNPLKLSGKICRGWGFHFFFRILTWVYPRSLLGVTICCYSPWRGTILKGTMMRTHRNGGWE